MKELYIAEYDRIRAALEDAGCPPDLAEGIAAERAYPAMRETGRHGRRREDETEGTGMSKKQHDGDKDMFNTLVNKLTNWGRNQWAARGYPGLRDKEVSALLDACPSLHKEYERLRP